MAPDYRRAITPITDHKGVQLALSLAPMSTASYVQVMATALPPFEELALGYLLQRRNDRWVQRTQYDPRGQIDANCSPLPGCRLSLRILADASPLTPREVYALFSDFKVRVTIMMNT